MNNLDTYKKPISQGGIIPNEYYASKSSTIVYVDMDDVLCAYSVAKDRDLLKCPDIKYPQSQYGFFENLSPVDGAIDSMISLMNDYRIELYILTAPSIKNPLCYTEKRNWVQKHLGNEMLSRLIISPDKSLLIGDFLIDDRSFGNGQDHFHGELIQFGSDDFPDWVHTLDYLKYLI